MTKENFFIALLNKFGNHAMSNNELEEAKIENEIFDLIEQEGPIVLKYREVIIQQIMKNNNSRHLKVDYLVANDQRTALEKLSLDQLAEQLEFSFKRRNEIQQPNSLLEDSAAVLTETGQYNFFLEGYKNGSASIAEVAAQADILNKALDKLQETVKQLR